MRLTTFVHFSNKTDKLVAAVSDFIEGDLIEVTRMGCHVTRFSYVVFLECERC